MSGWPPPSAPAAKPPRSPRSDLLTRGILIWSQIGSFSLACDRVDQFQAGAGIDELGRVEVFQQVCNGAIGPRVRHRMNMHSQYLLLHIRQDVGLRAKQIA